MSWIRGDGRSIGPPNGTVKILGDEALSVGSAREKRDRIMLWYGCIVIRTGRRTLH